MNLKSIIQSEVSQKEKKKYCILTHIYGIQKDSADEPICSAAMEMQTQRTDLWTWGQGKEGEGGTNGESNMETYTLQSVKQSAGIHYMTQETQTMAL